MSRPGLTTIARTIGERYAAAGARLSGYNLIRANYYSPLPDAEGLPETLWHDATPTPGVDLRLDQAESLLADDLAPFIREFAPPEEATPQSTFHLHNGTYESVDAESLYAVIRWLQPATVVELGSGASSHVIDAARVATTQPFNHHIFDPYPFDANPMGEVPSATVHRQGSETLTADDLGILTAGDVLFVDTTHTVKTGGDCQNIYLRLLPQLASGVYVHVHDIFLPFEYPRAWVVDQKRAWAEQYLLQAFLAFNEEFEVVLPCHALARLRPAAVARAVPSFRPGVAPGAFWLRRR